MKSPVTEAQFAEFTDLVLSNLDDTALNASGFTAAETAKDLLERVSSKLFFQERQQKERYNQYLALKAEFEPKSEPAQLPKPSSTEAYLCLKGGKLHGGLTDYQTRDDTLKVVFDQNGALSAVEILK